MYLKKQWDLFALISIILVFFFAFSTIALHRYWQYAAWYYDFGIFYSAIGKLAQGLPPTIDHLVYSGKNILGDHFHPIIFLITPFVAFFPRGETLLVAQAAFVALSGFLMYLLSKELTKSKIQSLLFVGIYFSFVGLHNALITEFHEIVLLPLPLSIFFYGMVKKELRLYLLGLVGVLLTKETTFIIPFWFGIVLFFQNKDRWKKIGLLTSVASVLYFVLIVFVVIPAIGGREYFYFPEPSEGALGIDVLTAKSMFNTFASFGFLPLFSPSTLVPVLFNWYSRIQRFTNFDLGMHYNAELAPTLLLASVYGWQKLKKKFVFVSKNALYILMTITLCAIIFSIQVLKSPLLLLSNQAFFDHTQNLKFLDELVEQIPKDGVVMAQTNIAAKIAHRNTYFLRENYSDFDPDFIVIDLRDGQEPSNFYGLIDFEKLTQRIATDSAYSVFYQSGEQIIYSKK